MRSTFIPVEVKGLDPKILAPFIKEVNPDTYEAKLELPAGLCDRQKNPAFLEHAFTDGRPTSVGQAKMQLREVDTSDEVETKTMEKRLEERFEMNHEWHARVEKAMKHHGFIQDQTGWVDEQTSNTATRTARDDLFTVRVDNLPEQMNQMKLTRLLEDAGCSYFAKVIVPRDMETGECKRFGFVKFEKLRWALKFLEDHRNTLRADVAIEKADQHGKNYALSDDEDGDDGTEEKKDMRKPVAKAGVILNSTLVV